MRKLLTLILVISPFITQAQLALSTSNPDSLSYVLYIKQDWKGLHKMEKSHIEEVPYLTKYRIALANYYDGKTLKATRQFVDLYKQNRLDSNILHSAYYALVETGFSNEAEEIRKKAIPSFQRNLPQIPIKPVSQMTVGYGNSIITQNSSLTAGLAGTNTYQESDLMKKSSYSFINLEGQLSERLSYSLNYSVITINRSRVFDYQSYDSVNHTQGTYSFLGTTVNYDSAIYQYNSKQNNQGIVLWQSQLYLGLSYKLGLRTEFNPFGLMGDFRYQNLNSTYSTEGFQAQSYHILDSYRPKYTFAETFERKSIWLYGGEFGLYNRNLNVKHLIGGSFGFINNKHISQGKYAVNWYPLHNYKLFLNAQAIAIKVDNAPVTMVYNAVVGLGLGKRAYCNATATIGNFRYGNADNGRILYNYPDDGVYRFTTSVGYYLSSQFRAEFTFSYINMKATQTSFTESAGFYTQTKNFKLYFPLLTFTYQL